MAKGRHQKDKLWLVHNELNSSNGGKKKDEYDNYAEFKIESCALSNLRFQKDNKIVADKNGNVYLRKAAEDWQEKYTCSPDGDDSWEFVDCNIQWSEDGMSMICPLTAKTFTKNIKIVMNWNNGYVYSAAGLNMLVTKGKNISDPMDTSPLNLKTDLVVLWDPVESPKRPKPAVTSEFLKSKLRNVSKAGSYSNKQVVLTNANPLAKRILKQLEVEGGELVENNKKFARHEEVEGYEDPITGEVKLVESRLHTSGAAAASLTSTSSAPEYSKKFKYLSSREYRDIVYARMTKRRHENSEVRITLKVSGASDLVATLYAWRFPEAVHQLTITASKSAFSKFEKRPSNDSSLAEDCVWSDFRTWFADTDDEIVRIARYLPKFIEAGAIIRTVDVPDAFAVVVRGFPCDLESIQVLGALDELSTAKIVGKREFTIESSAVLVNPFVDCEQKAIEEYRELKN